MGLRNAWRWSFDSATGDLWLGDVGQSAYEEVDIIELGGNYGWRCREGAHDHITTGNCPGGFTDPVIEYGRTVGQSITGGFVYRGSAIPELVGRYVFADYITGRIFASVADGQGGYTYEELLDTPYFISSFAEDENGELLFLEYDFANGRIHRIVQGSGSSTDTIPTLLSDTGCVDAVDPTQPSAGLIPYDINVPFWSDGAEKERFYAIPDGTTIDVDADGDWLFPIGTVLVKNFRLNDELFETRLFMRHTDGQWGGYTYEWNQQGTDATRVIGGKTKDVQGQPWVYPSEAGCMNCHTQAANFSLGIEHLQLNRDFEYPSTQITANQLSTTETIGMLTAPLSDIPDNLPSLADLSGVSQATPKLDNPGDLTFDVSVPVSMQLTAFDPNGDALSYSASGLPTGLSIDAMGLITGTPTVIGMYSVELSVTDGSTIADVVNLTWSVDAAGVCADCLDFNVVTTESYPNQDPDGDVTVLDGGATIRLDNNTWRQTIMTFDITADTVMEFTFESTAQGEIHGVLFDDDANVSEDQAFKLWGTQPWAIGGFDYVGSGPQQFRIPLGSYFTGNNLRLVLVNDDDALDGSNSSFSNVRIFEDTSPGVLSDFARSYLHSNCSGCHRPGGPTPASMDVRYQTLFDQTNTCNEVPVSGTLGISGALVVAPGDANASLLVQSRKSARYSWHASSG